MGLWNRRRADQIDILREAERIAGPVQEKSKGDRGGKARKLQQAQQKAADKQRKDNAKKVADLNRIERNRRAVDRARKGTTLRAVPPTKPKFKPKQRSGGGPFGGGASKSTSRASGSRSGKGKSSSRFGKRLY